MAEGIGNVPRDKIFFKTAMNCLEAFEAIEDARQSSTSFDLAILDYSLPPYIDKGIFTGADIAILIAHHFALCKCLIITSHTEILLIYDIVRKVNPHGFATKNEITSNNLRDILCHLLSGHTFKSNEVKKCIDEVWKKNYISEDYNRQILFYLSQGYRVKDLEKKISLSGSAIQSRITKLKSTFAVQDERELVRVLFSQGFL